MKSTIETQLPFWGCWTCQGPPLSFFDNESPERDTRYFFSINHNIIIHTKNKVYLKLIVQFFYLNKTAELTIFTASSVQYRIFTATVLNN